MSLCAECGKQRATVGATGAGPALCQPCYQQSIYGDDRPRMWREVEIQKLVAGFVAVAMRKGWSMEAPRDQEALPFARVPSDPPALCICPQCGNERGRTGACFCGELAPVWEPGNTGPGYWRRRTSTDE